NPDRVAIASLSPDLVVANKEENRELDVRRLREAGVPVWVTDIGTLQGALASMRRLFGAALGWGVPDWLDEAERRWSRPVPHDGRRLAVATGPVPGMRVGRDKSPGALLGRRGRVSPVAGHGARYPHVDRAEGDTSGLDLVLPPDEPYVFTPHDGREARS